MMARSISAQRERPPRRGIRGELASRFTAAALVTCSPLATAQVPSEIEAARRPNIVLILADDLGYGEVGFNGQPIHRTPHLDRLAAQGLRFTQHYAGSAVCAPSRCVLLTGRHTGFAEIGDNIGIDRGGCEIRPALPAGSVTLATALRAAGYRTGCIGKWGLGDEGTTGVPWQQGFDHFFGYLHNTHGTRYYTEFIYRNHEKVALRGNYGNWRKQYGPDLLLDEALGFIEENRGRNFFLYYPFNLVHGQYVAPPAGDLPQVVAPPGVELSEKERTYVAMAQRLDRDVGRLVEKIDALGIGRDTLIIFTSDNGGRGLGDRNDAAFRVSGGLRGGKADLYEGGIRVPTVMRWEGTVPPGDATGHVSGFVDYLATFCELAGVPLPAPTEGVSFAPLLRGAPQRAHEFLYWELAKRDEPRVVPRQALRAGPWKLVRNGDDPHELYHLGDDPAEARNLASARPDVLARLAALLANARQDHAMFPLRAGLGFD